jgi:hypothetical protein
MASEPSIYRRLPGRGTTLTSYVRLYQGPDHLLQVSSTGYSENYRRFFYRDIQALIVRRTNGQITFAVLWGVLALLFGLPATVLAANNAIEGAIVMFVFAGLFLAGLVINWLLGPTCACDIQTAVQIERLPTLRRIRSAQQFLQRLKGQIEAQQGPLSAETLAAGLAEMWRAAAFEATNPPMASGARTGPAPGVEAAPLVAEPSPQSASGTGTPPVAS